MLGQISVLSVVCLPEAYSICFEVIKVFFTKKSRGMDRVKFFSCDLL